MLLGLFLSANTFIAGCYLAIAFLIFRALLRQQQHLISNPLVLATAGIFLSCGLGHGSHVLYAFVGRDSNLLMSIQVGFDLVTAAIAGTYLTLRRQYSLLIDGPLLLAQTQSQLTSTNEEMAKINTDLETLVAERTAALQESNEELLAEITGRQRVEAALRESEEKFRTLVENANDIIYSLSLAGELSYVSPNWTDILGHDVSEIRGSSFIPLIYPDDLENCLTSLQSVMATGIKQTGIEYRISHKDGTWRWHLSSVSPAKDQNGNILYFVGICRDITNWKLSESALKESEERFRQLAETIDEVFWMTDVDTKQVIYVSPAYEKIWGRVCESLYQKPQTFLDGIHPDDRDRVQDAINSQKVGEYNEEYRVIQPNGNERWVRDRAFPILDATGQIYRIVGVAEDISDRKRQEERLRLLESVVVNANDAIIITEAEPIDLPGPRILYVNDAFTRMTGYTLEEVVGKTPRILQGENSDRLALDQVRTALTNGQPVLVELINYHKDGTQFWAELSLVPVADETGWYTHWVAIQRNITQRKQAEAEILRAFEKEKELTDLKTHFVSMASHEFRTPLATILFSAGLLEKYGRKWTDEKKLVHLQRIQTSVEQMTNLLNDVLLLGKAEAGKQQLNPEFLDLDQFCRSLVNELQLTAGKQHSIEFVSDRLCHAQGDRNSCEAYMDTKLLRAILSNLLSNAIKYSPVGSTISFQLTYQDTDVLFQIKDRGIGIPIDDKKRLFEPFYRATNVGELPGTGLGLAVVKNCVTLHNGQISLESDIGVGTTFSVQLPLKINVVSSKNQEDPGDRR